MALIKSCTGKISAQPHTIFKQICFPNGNVMFLSLFSLSKNWIHNVFGTFTVALADHCRHVRFEHTSLRRFLPKKVLAPTTGKLLQCGFIIWADHWIRIASIVLCLDLQSLPTHVSDAEQSGRVFCSLAAKGFLKFTFWALTLRQSRQGNRNR